MAFVALGHDDVLALLPMRECISLMRGALAALARGEGLQPLRGVLSPPDLPGFMVVMPAYVPGTLGAKVLGIFDANTAIGKDPHQGVVLLLSPATGELSAVLDAAAVTSIRTAAVSALATDVLARPDATRLTVIGTGVQARFHVPAIAAVRTLTEVRLVGRDPDRTSAVAAALASGTGIPVHPTVDAREALRGADIVATVTSAVEPVLRREWLGDGAHINAVGACVPTARELDTATVVAARVYVDRRESAHAEAGDLVIASAEAGLGPDHIVAELGEVVTGAAPGRGSANEITIFESLGIAAEDLAAAAYVRDRALAEGRGTHVPF